MSDYVLSATLELKDELSGKLNNAKRSLSEVKGAASSAGSALDASFSKAGTSAMQASGDVSKLRSAMSALKGKDVSVSLRDSASAGLSRVKNNLTGLKDKIVGVSLRDIASSGLSRVKSNLTGVKDKSVSVKLQDDASSKITGIKNQLNGLGGRNPNPRVGLRDEATPKVSRIKSELSSIAGKSYDAVVNIKQNGMNSLKSGMSNFANGMLMNTPMQMMGAAGMGFGVYDTIKTYMDFEAQMKKVQAISGASGEQFDALTNKAKEMGAATQFSATEAAQGLEYMAMAGWGTDQMLGGIKGVMDLAAASGEDLGRTSDIVTDALTAFGLKAEDSGRFADVLAQASSSSNTNVAMMGETFKYVAPIAGALKYSVEDTAVAIGLMANAGIKASEAGTSLRSIFTRLAKPPKAAATALDALGVSIENADGTAKPFRETMKDLREAFKGKTEIEKASMAADIAGQEAMSGFLAIINATDKDFDSLMKKIDGSQGTAAKQAAIMNDNLKGDLKSLASVWEAVQLDLMKDSGASDGLRSLVQTARDELSKIKGYMKDGFGFADAGKVAADVLTKLKNKFIEFDGVGSLLAGGVLIGGLAKIISMAKRAYSGVRNLAGMVPGVRGSASAARGASAAAGLASASNMVVNAANVVVNGKMVAGGGAVAGGAKNAKAYPQGVILGPNGQPISSTTVASTKPAPQLSTWQKIKPRAQAFVGGAAVASIFAALDVYSQKQTNDMRADEAAEVVKTAKSEFEKIRNDNTASAEQIKQAYQNVADAQYYQATTERDNRVAMGESLGAGIGSALGAGIGAMFGPMGMVAGGIIGEVAGAKIGNALTNYNPMAGLNINAVAEWFEKPKEKTYFDIDTSKPVPVVDLSKSEAERNLEQDNRNDFGIATDATGMAQQSRYYSPPTMTEAEPEMPTYASMQMDSSDAQIQGVQALRDTVVGAATDISNAWVESNAISQDSTLTAMDSMSSSMSETSSAASDAGSQISDAYVSANDTTVGVWSTIAGFFDGSVYSPTKSGAEGAGTSISGSFENSANNTKGAWSGVVGFFNGIWNELKQGAAQAAASIAQSLSNAAASARSGGHTTIASAIDWLGNNAAYLAGTSYKKQGDAIGTSYAPGGWTEVNEHGGEIIDLPQGSRVYPHATTLKMLKDTFGGALTLNDDFTGANTPDIPSLKSNFLDNDFSVGMPKFDISGLPTGMQDFAPVSQMMQSAKSLFSAFVPSFASEANEIPVVLPDMPQVPDFPKVPEISQDVPSMPEMPQIAEPSKGRTSNSQPISVTISGNTFTIREEADIDRIAYQLLQLMRDSFNNMNPVGGVSL